MSNMKLAKDSTILDMLERLRAALGSDAFDIVDHWPADLIAVGIASPTNHQVLVYIAVGDDGYYAELELPPDPANDSLYEVAGSHSGLSFGQLVGIIAKHLSVPLEGCKDAPEYRDTL